MYGLANQYTYNEAIKLLPKETKEHQSYYNFISLKAFNFTTLKHVNQI